MADPVLANAMRVMAIFPHQSSLPEDRMVNTFAALYEPTNYPTFRDAFLDVAGALDDFYNVAHGSNSIMTFLSPELADPVQFKGYDLSVAPPRFPEDVNATFNILAGGTALPSEVALCLSLVASQNSPRNRGRIYLGPLGDEVAADNANDSRVPSATAVSDLAAAGDFLASFDLSTDGFTFCILSQRDAQMKPITGGWVDNAFDTQRRRGVAATNRTTFGSYLGQ